MQWCYTAAPGAFYRVKNNETPPKASAIYGITKTPVTSDPATAGCLWQMVYKEIHEKLSAITLETAFLPHRQEYVATAFNIEGSPVFECHADTPGRAAMLMLEWIWFASPETKE